MAMARCEAHKPRGITKNYLGPARIPHGDGKAIVCGECDSPAKLWLDELEEKQYESGTRAA
jgi:hypothetical protein